MAQFKKQVRRFMTSGKWWRHNEITVHAMVYDREFRTWAVVCRVQEFDSIPAGLMWPYDGDQPNIDCKACLDAAILAESEA